MEPTRPKKQSEKVIRRKLTEKDIDKRVYDFKETLRWIHNLENSSAGKAYMKSTEGNE